MRSAGHRFGVTLLTMTAILAGANVFVARASRNSVPRQVMRSVQGLPRTVDVLAMGNSLVAAGFDARVVTRAAAPTRGSFTAVNGALGASDIISHLALSDMAWKSGSRIDVLIYGFFDNQMWQSPPVVSADLIGNRTLLYHANPDFARSLGHMTVTDRLMYEVYRPVALLRERGAIWERVEKVRRRLSEVGMTRKATNAFGRRDDFAALELDGQVAFERNARFIIDSVSTFAEPIRLLFREARRRHTAIVIVEMPMSPSHRRRFYDGLSWPLLRVKAQRAVEKEGGTYIDASAWLTDSADFADNLHLAPAGARRFSERLGAMLRKTSR